MALNTINEDISSLEKHIFLQKFGQEIGKKFFRDRMQVIVVLFSNSDSFCLEINRYFQNPAFMFPLYAVHLAIVVVTIFRTRTETKLSMYLFELMPVRCVVCSLCFDLHLNDWHSVKWRRRVLRWKKTRMWVFVLDQHAILLVVIFGKWSLHFNFIWKWWL